MAADRHFEKGRKTRVVTTRRTITSVIIYVQGPNNLIQVRNTLRIQVQAGIYTRSRSRWHITPDRGRIVGYIYSAGI